MLWQEWPFPKQDLDRDRKVTLTVGQLTDALAEALKVVSDAEPEPTFKVGDVIPASLTVTGVDRDNVHFTFDGAFGPLRKSYAVKASLLKLIKEAA